MMNAHQPNEWVARTPKGFTLMEVMITMAILAILAAIAIPNYTAYIQRGYRADAKAAILQVAQWEERFRTETNNYTAAIPAGMAVVPPSGTQRYAVAVAVAAGQFTVTATAMGPQAADECGNFSLNQLGVRAVIIGGTVYGAGTNEFDRCWGR